MEAEGESDYSQPLTCLKLDSVRKLFTPNTEASKVLQSMDLTPQPFAFIILTPKL